MKTTKLGALLASTAMGIAMSPAERRMGRLMRAPDGHPAPAPKDPIEAMMEDDGVEGQWGGDAGEKPEKPQMRQPEKPAVDADDEGDEDDGQEGADDGEEDADEGEENEENGKQKPGKKPPSERIRELNRLLKEERRAREIDRKGFEARLERIEKGLPADEKGDKPAEERVAPDPTDLEKYPLGALDDRYIEDKLDFLAEKKAEEKLNRTLQRQQEEDQAAESSRVLAEIQQKADMLTDKGNDLFDDFEDKVVKPAMQGAFPLTQETFEACAEAKNGAAILYDLASDVKEAAKVAALSPYQQLKYVLDKDAEKEGKGGRRATNAGDPPPNNAPRGARGKFEVPDDTDDLEAFGKKFDKLT